MIVFGKMNSVKKNRMTQNIEWYEASNYIPSNSYCFVAERENNLEMNRKNWHVDSPNHLRSIVFIDAW